jgi:hypothetical protein
MLKGDSGGPLYLVSEAGVHKQIGQNWFLSCRVTAVAPCIWSQRLVYTGRLAKTGFYMQGDSGGPLYLVSEVGVHRQIGQNWFLYAG